LAKLLNNAIESSDVAEEQIRYRKTLGDLFVDHLAEPAKAIELFSDVLKCSPDDAHALQALERLYERTGRSDEYLKILDRRIDAAASDRERIAIYLRLAKEWEGQGAGLAKAADYLERALTIGGGTDDIYKSLERLYWGLKNYDKLAEAYRRHIALLERPEAKVGLYIALGKVYEDHLVDLGSAVDTYQDLLTADSDNLIGLESLTRLYRKLDQADRAIEVLSRLIARGADPAREVEAYSQMGALYLTERGDEAKAEAALAKALELDDTHVPTLLALAELYRGRRDFAKAARALRDAAGTTGNALDKAQRLHEAARLFLNELHDDMAGIAVLEELMVVDPDHVEGGQALVSAYLRAETVGRAVPVLEMLIRKAGDKDRKRLVELQLKLGECCLKLGDHDRALAAYRQAIERDPTSEEAIRHLAGLLYDRGDFEEAGKLYQAMLVRSRESLGPGEVVRLYLRLGEVKARTGDTAKALNLLEKAVETDRSHAEALQRLVQAYEEKQDYEAIIRAKKGHLASLAHDAAERSRLLEEIGDTLVEKLKRYGEAGQFYQESAEALRQVAGEDTALRQRTVLNKLLDVRVHKHLWKEAVETIKEIETLESDPAHSYRLNYTAGVIYRDELKQPREAVIHLDRALEADPTNMKAFGKLKAVCEQQGNFKALAKAYRRMLRRLPESTPIEEQVRLWHELGDICQDRLQDAKGAIVAFEMARRIDPSNALRDENLARLYASAGPDAFDKAIEVNQQLLQKNPMSLKAYKELRRLYGESAAHDKEWCVSAVLSVLQAASAGEKEFYESHRPKDVRRVSHKLTDDVWRTCLYHPRQSPVLCDLMQAVAPVVIPMAVRPGNAYGLKANTRLHPEGDGRAYASALAYCTQVMDREADEVYLHGEAKSAVTAVVGGDPERQFTMLWLAPSLLERPRPELVFRLSRALSYFRPDHLLWLVTAAPTVVQAIVLACLRLARPDAPVRGDVAELDRLVDVLSADLPAKHVELIDSRYAELIRVVRTGGIESWMCGVELTATRAGLVICDDLATAARIVGSEETAYGGLGTEDRLAQLFAFAVSESFFGVRQKLGLTIG
jgi:tetratricopeptide (TPR) repeat protein